MRTHLFLAAAVALVAAVPLIGASPLACHGTCTIEAHSFGYRPPALELADGSEVVFTSVDTSHVNAEQSVLQAEMCFSVTSAPGVDSDPVRFDIVDGDVVATTNPGTASASSALCGNAQALFDGSHVIPVVCIIHPHMKAALVIAPAA